MKFQSFRKESENIKMKENENINDYSSRFIKTNGEISDKRIVEKILISVLEKLSSCCHNRRNKGYLKISIQELIGSLKSFEHRLTRM